MTPTLPSASPITWRTSARIFIDPCPCEWLPCLCLWPSSPWRSGVFSVKTSLSWGDSEAGIWDAGSDVIRLPRWGDWAEAISFAVWTREARVATGCPYRDEKDSEGEWWEWLETHFFGVLSEVTLPTVGMCSTLDARDEGVVRLGEWLWEWEWPCSIYKKLMWGPGEKIGV